MNALDRFQARKEWNEEAESKETQQNILAKLQSTIKKKVGAVVGGSGAKGGNESPTKSPGERTAAVFGLNLAGIM